MYIYIHICIYTYIYIRTYTYIYVFLYIHMCVCVCAIYVRVYMRTCCGIFVCVHVCMHVEVALCLYKHHVCAYARSQFKSFWGWCTFKYCGNFAMIKLARSMIWFFFWFASLFLCHSPHPTFFRTMNRSSSSYCTNQNSMDSYVLEEPRTVIPSKKHGGTKRISDFREIQVAEISNRFVQPSTYRIPSSHEVVHGKPTDVESLIR